MKKSEQTINLLINHCKIYPKLQISDVFKFLYQSTFGCEHMALSETSAQTGIAKEYAEKGCDTKPLVQALDGNYSRVNLSYLNQGIGVNTLAKLFVLSAKKEKNAKARLTNKLKIARIVVCEKLQMFSTQEFDKQLVSWKASGYAPIHHSKIFASEYNPSYRVISNEYIPLLPLFSQLDKLLDNKSVKLAIDGHSASGKTTLSRILQSVYDCTVFCMDDFFLRPEQRTKERYLQPGENIDWERFLTEVLEPLENKQHVNYQRFDCSVMKVMQGEIIKPEKLVVIEGAYSMHPQLSGHYDFSVFLDISSREQKKRILNRNTPKQAEMFFEKWIPLENKYFSKLNIKDKCNMSLCL